VASYLLRRLLATLLLVLVVSSAAFVITRIAAARALTADVGLRLDPMSIQRRAHEVGLDRPMLAQWGSWLGGLVRFDLGTSLYYNSPVAPIVGERARNTALLATTAFLVALALGIPPAFVTATRPGSLAARAVRATSLLLLSLPSFVSSLGLVLIAARTGWLPAGGLASSTVGTTFAERALDVAWHLPLPVLALALPMAATFERLQAQALADALAQPPVRAARARGIPARTIVWRHAGRLAVKPVAGIGGLAFGALLSGSFAVEAVTAWPGLGRLTIDALRYRDLYLVAGCAAAGTLVLALGLLIADLVIAWSDPRVRDELVGDRVEMPA
jgi:peptide/nickel transport system permease protein